MNLEIRSTLNYFDEEGALLGMIAEENSYQKIKEKVVKKFGISTEKTFHRFEVAENILDEVREELKEDMEQVTFYFKQIGSIRMCLGKMAMLVLENNMDMTAEQLEAYTSVITPQQARKLFIKKLDEYFDMDIIKLDNSLEQDDIFSIIEQLDLEPQDKWNLQSMLLQREQHVQKLISLYQKVEKVLMQHQDEVTELLNEFTTFWEKKVKTEDVVSDLKEYFTVEAESQGGIIVPSIFNINVIAYIHGDEKELSPNYFILGVMFDEDFYLSRNSLSRDFGSFALRSLKILSDKSKLEILMKLKEKKAYGAELAKALHLTTGTISYHMNALITCQMVKVERENNKIYYSVNEPVVEELLNYLRESLL